MPFAFLPFPYLSSYTLTNQFLILIALASVSYFYRSFRLALLTAIGAWAYVAFKAIAMFGFYVNFFIVGVGYIVTGAVALWNFPELLKTFIDSLEGK
ncbi:hypothetical protein C8R43DRAFT_1123610 [Mycena crocata]|nr:hypothetical protein C8R43DRAFT_1123610 [Mycena crocata]